MFTSEEINQYDNDTTSLSQMHDSRMIQSGHLNLLNTIIPNLLDRGRSGIHPSGVGGNNRWQEIWELTTLSRI